jgi:hypothetical protein
MLGTAVQIGIRIPVILVALAGVVLALVMMRRLGTLAAVLGAGASFFIAVNQLMAIVWVLHLSSLARDPDAKADDFTTVGNVYTMIDAVLITVAAVLLVVTFLARKPAPAV